MGAAQSRLDPDPTDSFAVANIAFQRPVSLSEEGEVGWSQRMNFVLELEPRELANGRDDDGDELVDELRLVLVRRAGEAEGAKVRLAAGCACQASLAASVQNLQRAVDPALGLGSAMQLASFGGWSTRGEASDLEFEDGAGAQPDYRDGLVELVATARGSRGGARQVLVLRAAPNTIWRFGASGKEFLHLDSNARVDSYDSRFGTYESQLASPRGSNAHARQNGDVGSNGDVSLDQNAKVRGDAIAGVDHATIVLGNAVVSGARTTNTAEVELPPISMPTYVNYGNLTVHTSTIFNAGNRTYGTLRVGSNTTLTIQGPANSYLGAVLRPLHSARVGRGVRAVGHGAGRGFALGGHRRLPRGCGRLRRGSARATLVRSARRSRPARGGRGFGGAAPWLDLAFSSSA